MDDQGPIYSEQFDPEAGIIERIKRFIEPYLPTPKQTPDPTPTPVPPKPMPTPPPTPTPTPKRIPTPSPITPSPTKIPVPESKPESKPVTEPKKPKKQYKPRTPKSKPSKPAAPKKNTRKAYDVRRSIIEKLESRPESKPEPTNYSNRSVSNRSDSYGISPEVQSYYEELAIQPEPPRRPQPAYIAKTIPVTYALVYNPHGELMPFKLAFYNVTAKELWGTSAGYERIQESLRRNKLKNYRVDPA